MALSLVALIGALLGAPVAPPKTTCIPEPGAGVLAVSKMSSQGPPDIPVPLRAWTGKELLLWPRQFFWPDKSVEARWSGGGWAYAPATDRWRKLPALPGPSTRNASLVWAGSAVVAWGGIGNGDGAVAEGVVFDPTSGRSRPTSTRDAPSPRADAVALWTGSEVIVWGGFDDVGFRCDGGRYLPSKDTWTPLPSPLSTPTCEGFIGERPALATWAGSRLVVVIARNRKPAAFAYEPGSGKWTELPQDTAPSRLVRLELEPGGDGFAYAVGSQEVQGTQRGFLYRLDFQRPAWVPVAPSCSMDQLTSVGGVPAQIGVAGVCLYDLASGGCRSMAEPAGLGAPHDALPQVAVSAGPQTLLWRGAGAVVRLGNAAARPPPP